MEQAPAILVMERLDALWEASAQALDVAIFVATPFHRLNVPVSLYGDERTDDSRAGRKSRLAEHK